MVFYHPDHGKDRKYIVEAKNTTASLSEKKIAKLIFLAYLENREADNRFLMFAVNFRKSELTGKILDPSNCPSQYQEYCDWLEDNLDEVGQAPENWRDEFADFLANSEFYARDFTGLQNAAIEKMDSSKRSLVRYARHLLDEVESAKNVSFKREILQSNLVPVELPTQYYEAQLALATLDDLHDYFYGIRLPGFHWLGHGRIRTLSPLGDSNPLSQAVQEGPMSFPMGDLRRLDSAQTNRLVLEHLRAVARTRGMREYGGRFFVPITPADRPDPDQDNRIYRLPDGGERKVTKVLRLEEDKGTKVKDDINFVLHHAVHVKVGTYWNHDYLELRPTRVYSSDGRHLISDSDALRHIEISLRLVTKFDRNASRRSWIDFWKRALFSPRQPTLYQESRNITPVTLGFNVQQDFVKYEILQNPFKIRSEAVEIESFADEEEEP